MRNKAAAIFVLVLSAALAFMYSYNGERNEIDQELHLGGAEPNEIQQTPIKTPEDGLSKISQIQQNSEKVKNGNSLAGPPVIRVRQYVKGNEIDTELVNSHPKLTHETGLAEKSYQQLIDPKIITEPNNAIILQAGAIDTTKGPVQLPEELTFDASSEIPGEVNRYLVQFTGPVLQEWKTSMVGMGVEFGDYLPNNGFIVSMTVDQRKQIEGLEYIKWIDYYHPAYKLSSGFENTLILEHSTKNESTRKKQQTLGTATDTDSPSAIESESGSVAQTDLTEAGGEESILITVQTFSDGELVSLYGIADTIAESVVLKSSDTRKSRVILEVPATSLNESIIKFARAAEVEWIEPFVPPELNNNEMHWVVQSNTAEENPLWDKGLTGSGQIVGIGDTGLDIDMVFFWDDQQGIPTSSVNMSQRKVISYHDLAGNGDWDSHDHGTHVAGTVAGKSLGNNSQYNGIAYDAKLVIQDIGNGGSLVGLPGDLNTYFQQAYNDGARIHSNSWGSDVNGIYTSYSQDADEFMWNHKDFLIVVSAGNEGDEVDTINSPGTAKNVLTSGASQNAHSGYNQEHVAYFSSNGPTDDGRIKPTVTAPGYYINSANSDWNINTFNSNVRSMSGTSMSAPSHAGSLALVRQYFVDGYYPSGLGNSADSMIPSGALLKAVLVNSVESMSGNYTDGPIPSTGQGWGRILLDNTLFFEGDNQNLFVEDNQTGLNTTEERVYTFYSDGGQPCKITLVWTDHYPSLSAAVKIVNDLDLTVVSPSGTYLGNVFSSGVSVMGGSQDRLNVVENVFIANPAAGLYTITVRGHNIPSGPQPYALVVTGLTNGSSKGTVSFDSDYYTSNAVAKITVDDLDLNTTSERDVVEIAVGKAGGGSFQLELTETGGVSGTFTAEFTIANHFQVSDGDEITATYNDADDGTGSTQVEVDSARIDDTFPVISSILVSELTDEKAVLSWQVSEPATSRLSYRPQGGSQWVHIDTLMGERHQVSLENLNHATVYEFQIFAEDTAGNWVISDNNGLLHLFKTDVEQILMSDSMDSGTSLFVLTGGSNQAGENGMWHISDYKPFSSPKSWYYGLESTKDYDTGFHNWGQITTVDPVDLSGVDNAKLLFHHILSTEDWDGYDLAKVQVSRDNITYETLYQSDSSTGDWEEVKIDLSGYLGDSIYIRFEFDTVDEYSNYHEGWLVDNIKVASFVDAPGDLTGDGLVTLGDCLLPLQVLSGVEPTVPVQLSGVRSGNGRVGFPEVIQCLNELSR